MLRELQFIATVVTLWHAGYLAAQQYSKELLPELKIIYLNDCPLGLKFELICRKKRVILGTAFHSCGSDDSDDDDDNDDDDAAGDDDARTICSNGGCGVGALGGS